MRNETVRKIMEDISPERRKELDDMLDAYIEKVKVYHQSLSDWDLFDSIVQSEDFNSELMGSILHNLYEFPIELYGYLIHEFDTGLEPAYYIFTKQN
jgi:hypothetical protein